MPHGYTSRTYVGVWDSFNLAAGQEVNCQIQSTLYIKVYLKNIHKEVYKVVYKRLIIRL
jgi:hypothetical protein